MVANFYLGCAVWAYKAWDGLLFPAGSKSRDYLQLYSRRLTTVEGNTTFYAVPNPEVVERWAAETPETFQFCFKLPRDISHVGHLAKTLPDTEAFVERVAPLGSRFGPFFLQLPGSYGPDRREDLMQWLDQWPTERRLAVEVRHPAWYGTPHEQWLMDTLEAHGAGRVVMDVRPLALGPLPGAEADLQRARDNKPDVPMHPLHSGGFALVRYIGHPDLPLNGALLAEWAERVAGWLSAGIDVYMFMHCPIETFSPQLCRMFQRELEQHADVSPLPWNTLEQGLQQATLF